MTQPISTITPLRQRMIEDMKLRKLSSKTQASYLLAVKKLTRFLGHSPATDVASKMRTVPVPRKLPVVLNRDEAARLIAAAGNPK